MAQKTEKEETEFKVIVSESTLSLCINNCGFTGTPATKNMCQKCFNATSSSSAGLSTAAHLFSSDKAVRSTTSMILDRTGLMPETSSAVEMPDRRLTLKSNESTVPAMSRRTVNRCSGCRRKVGLTGFRCRCGDLYCSEHRYSDRHECSYDYKTAGREAIERENPVVKAAKIIKV